MGSTNGISCRECNYSKDFKIGIGMMYSPYNLRDFESEFALLPYLIRSKKSIAYIKELLNNKNAVIADGYGHEIYQCPKCSELYGRFFIHLDYDCGSFEVDYQCTKCRTSLKQIDYEAKEEDGYECEGKVMALEQYPCPKCGKHSLYEGGTIMMLWD